MDLCIADQLPANFVHAYVNRVDNEIIREDSVDTSNKWSLLKARKSLSGQTCPISIC